MIGREGPLLSVRASPAGWPSRCCSPSASRWGPGATAAGITLADPAAAISDFLLASPRP